VPPPNEKSGGRTRVKGAGRQKPMEGEDHRHPNERVNSAERNASGADPLRVRPPAKRATKRYGTQAKKKKNRSAVA